MESYTVPELKKLARERGYKGYSKMRKAEIIALLRGKRSPKRSPKSSNKCKEYQILNPSSNRCVSKTGKIGKKLLQDDFIKPAKVSFKHKKCSNEKILNPSSGKCVLKSGKIGRKILAELEPDVPIIESDFWLVYVKQSCPYCERSKRVLSKNHKKYKTILITPENEETFLKQIQKKSPEAMIYPIIFHNNTFIGSYSDLELVFGIGDTSILSRPNKSLNFILPKGKTKLKTTKFKGNAITEAAGLLYLMERYKNDCAVMAETIGVHTYSFSFYQIEVNYTKNIVNVPIGYWDSVKRCKGKRFLLMPIGIGPDKIDHSNILIYDSNTKTMERFEPHGFGTKMYTTQESNNIDKTIIGAFKKHMGNTFIKNYYNPLDFCPRISFQNLQSYEKSKMKGDPGGFCAAWSYWYANLRLANPDMTRKDVINKAISELNKSDYTYTEFIRSYSISMHKYKEALLKSNDPIKLFRQYAKLFSD